MSIKVCPHCLQPLKEYVGFNSYAGHPENPWDCLNAGCSPKEVVATAEEQVHPGWYSIERHYGTLWFREEDRQYAPMSNFGLTIDLDITTNDPLLAGRDDYCVTYEPKGVGNFAQLTIFPCRPGELVNYSRIIATRNVQAQTPSKSPATWASSQTPHTQLSPLVARSTVAGAQRQLTQDLCDDVLGACTPPQQGSGQPQTSDKPKLSAFQKVREAEFLAGEREFLSPAALADYEE